MTAVFLLHSKTNLFPLRSYRSEWSRRRNDFTEKHQQRSKIWGSAL